MTNNRHTIVTIQKEKMRKIIFEEEFKQETAGDGKAGLQSIQTLKIDITKVMVEITMEIKKHITVNPQTKFQVCTTFHYITEILFKPETLTKMLTDRQTDR